MLRLEDFMSIILLWKKGKAKREIARVTGHDRKTIRRVIKHYEKYGIERPVQIMRKRTNSSQD